MKKRLNLIVLVILLCNICGLFTLFASADENDNMTNVYSQDGRMATIPTYQVNDWCNVGWSTDFPYMGKEFWIDAYYLKYYTVDQYGTKLSKFDLANNLPIWNKVKVIWYNDNDWTWVSQADNIKSLKSVMFELQDGNQFYMPLGDLLRSKPINLYDFYPMILWSNPKTTFKISDSSWNNIQNYRFFIGMTKDEFKLVKGYKPDRINKSTYSWGTTEQWVYEGSNYRNSYYYFDDGILTSISN